MDWPGFKWMEKYYVLRIDLSDLELMQTTGMVFSECRDKIEKGFEIEINPLKEQLDKIPRRSSLVLVFCGDQVLTRFSSGESKILFEEIEDEDFYFLKTESESGWIIQSACRKSIVDPVLDLLKVKKMFALHMVFEPSVVPVISDLIGEGMIRTWHLCFQFRDGDLQWIIEEKNSVRDDSLENPVVVEGTSFSREGISMLAGLVHHLKDGSGVEALFKEQNNQSRYYKLFRRSLMGILTVLLSVLLVNYLLNSAIRQNLDQLKTSGESHAVTISEIERLNAQVQEFRNLSIKRYTPSKRSYSFYLEEVALQRPTDVWFNQLTIDPFKGKAENGKSLETDQSRINLTGETRDPVSLNKFIHALKDLPWVEDIELKNYEMFEEKTSASFDLIIRKANEL